MSSSSCATETHTHRAKDGRYYKTYDEKVKANIRSNETFLKTRGLDKLSQDFYRKSPVSKKKRPSPAALVSPEQPQRRSSRLQNQDVVADATAAIDLEFMERQLKRKERQEEQRRAKKARMNTTRQLTDQDRNKLEKVADEWVTNMHTYLLDVEDLSAANARTVTRQVTKLAAGVGVDYHHWDGNIFMKDTQVNLSMDFVSMLEDAKEWELTYGRDQGNGWAIRHPIKKMGNYQAYLMDK